MPIEEVAGKIGKKAHVFVVDRHSFPVHRSRLFCGVKDPTRDWGFSGKWGLYATLNCTRPGDLVFFYQRRIDEPQEERGFRGVYEIVSDPFFDDDDVQWSSFKVLGKCPNCGNTHPEKWDQKKRLFYCRKCQIKLHVGEHICPNRVLIKPVMYFKKSVDDNTAYVDRTDKGTLWTMLFRKIYGPGRERSVTPILPEEADKLIRLLKRINNNEISSISSMKPYKPLNKQRLQVSLGTGPKVKYEHVLQAWLMENLDKDISILREIIGPNEELEWFGNEIIYGIGGDKVDILTLHKRDGVRFKANVIELKDEDIKKEDIEQVQRYSYWISQLATANAEPRPKSLLLQPVLIGLSFDSKILSILRNTKSKQLRISYPWGDCSVNIAPPIGVTYEVAAGKIKFDIPQYELGG